MQQAPGEEEPLSAVVASGNARPSTPQACSVTGEPRDFEQLNAQPASSQSPSEDELFAAFAPAGSDDSSTPQPCIYIGTPRHLGSLRPPVQEFQSAFDAPIPADFLGWRQTLHRSDRVCMRVHTDYDGAEVVNGTVQNGYLSLSVGDEVQVLSGSEKADAGNGFPEYYFCGKEQGKEGWVPAAVLHRPVMEKEALLELMEGIRRSLTSALPKKCLHG